MGTVKKNGQEKRTTVPPISKKSAVDLGGMPGLNSLNGCGILLLVGKI
jgi:hypothetical protein